mgnify:CR=1 FL=1
MHSPEALTVNVVTQNALLDYGRTKKKLILPQRQRIASLGATIANQFPGELDVVGIQEAHLDKGFHNGQALAEMCGYGSGFWVNHNKKPENQPDSKTGRPGEYIGMFGSLVEDIEEIKLDANRSAVATIIAGVAFVTLHLRHGAGLESIAERAAEAKALTDYVSDYDNAVLYGDYNEPLMRLPYLRRYTPARSHVAKHGFKSAFELTGQKSPLTCPIEPYIPLFRNTKGWQGKFIHRGWALDDILVRGPRIRVIAAGVLDRVIVHENPGEYPAGVPLEGSDHDGLWATLQIAA